MKYFLSVNVPFYIIIFSDLGEVNSWGGNIFAIMWMACVTIFTVGEVFRERKYK